MDQDLLLEKVVSEIAHHEREIVNQFCKAFIAQKSLEGFDIKTLFDHFVLCVSHDVNNHMTTTYWFQKRNE